MRLAAGLLSCLPCRLPGSLAAGLVSRSLLACLLLGWLSGLRASCLNGVRLGWMPGWLVAGLLAGRPVCVHACQCGHSDSMSLREGSFCLACNRAQVWCVNWSRGGSVGYPTTEQPAMLDAR